MPAFAGMTGKYMKYFGAVGMVVPFPVMPAKAGTQYSLILTSYLET